MANVKVECNVCGGTGLYEGFAEPEGVAVVCLDCKGEGHKTLCVKPFTERRHKEGVKIVCRSSGSLIATGVGPKGYGITYTQFQNGQMP